MPRTALLTLSALVTGCLLGLIVENKVLRERRESLDQSVIPMTRFESQIETHSAREQAWQQTLRERKARLAALDWSMALLETRLQTLEVRVQMRLREASLENSISAGSQTESARVVDEPVSLDSTSIESQADIPAITGHFASPSWFVHVAASQDRYQAEALAQEAEAIIGMPLSVLDFEKLGFAVRACGLETQVKAQELVELLLKATRNDQLWIGRGC